MSDNTALAPGTGGDTIRDIDRGSAGVKTQVVQLDVGGPSTSPELLVSPINPMPVVGASDRLQTMLMLQAALLAAAAPTNGFVPIEIPAFLGGL